MNFKAKKRLRINKKNRNAILSFSQKKFDIQTRIQGYQKEINEVIF